MAKQQELKDRLKAIISSLNEDSTVNPEYTRGQVELAMDLLGYQDNGEELREELTAAADFDDLAHIVQAAVAAS